MRALHTSSHSPTKGAKNFKVGRNSAVITRLNTATETLQTALATRTTLD